MATLIRRIERFISEDIWQQPSAEYSPARRVLFLLAKKLYLAIRFFTARGVLSQAAALTYSTLLAIVPILAVVFAIARGFGYNKYIEIWFREALASQPTVSEVIIGFVNSYLVHIKSGVFLGVGLIFMLYTVMMLVSNVEQTFNHIWQVKKPRSLFRTFTDYMAIFFLFPILIVFSTGLSIFMTAIANQMPDLLMIRPMARLLMDLVPYVLMSLLFIGLYVFMPNTHVQIRHAVIPGILAGVAMQCLQLFYIHIQMWLSSYNAIYGSFAALPLFMLWVQISWTICLFGVELCYTNQNLDYFDYNTKTSDISYRYRLMLYALLLSRICKRFANGDKPLTSSELRQQTGVPIRIVNDLIYDMIDAGLLIEITSDEKGTTSTYMPAMSLSNLSLGMMLDRLEARGQWKLNLNVNDQFSSEWGKAVGERQNYLRQLRQIPLEKL
ncbi:MAG: YihY/virulence factor BrkB family protein [Prevotella sp.]|nr:YihY/virulence factor BrkB family protein [Prevotella sp.]